MAVRVLLMNGQPLFRDGLTILLGREGFDVVADTANLRDAVELAGRLHPDVAVLDIPTLDANGLRVVKEIRNASPETRNVALGGNADPSQLYDALRCGISGYVEKTQAIEFIAKAILEVSRGGIYLYTGNARSGRGECPVEKLSVRQRQVLQLIAEGKSMSEAARLLGVSVKTVEGHRSAIMTKLDIHDPAGLVRYAIRHGIIEA